MHCRASSQRSLPNQRHQVDYPILSRVNTKGAHRSFATATCGTEIAWGSIAAGAKLDCRQLMLLSRRASDVIQQRTGRHLQCLGDFVEDEHRGVADAALNAADVGAVQATMVGKAFLREALVLSQFL